MECASLEDSKSDALEEHHRLRNEIESLDQYIKDLHSDKDQLYNERDILRDKVSVRIICENYFVKVCCYETSKNSGYVLTAMFENNTVFVHQLYDSKKMCTGVY